MIIKVLTEVDLSPLLELYKDLHEKDSPAPPQQIIHAVWSSILANDSIRYFGAFEASRLVSTCTITLIPNLTRSCRPYGVIENVVTHKDFRRRGYGQAVLKQALDFAWGKNCYKVMLMTGQQNEGVFKFYESAGFLRHEKEAFIAHLRTFTIESMILP